MTKSKQSPIQEKIQWLIDNDIEFIEFVNGHVRVFNNGEPFMDFWTTTKKFILHNTGVYGVDWHLIQKYILDMKNRQF